MTEIDTHDSPHKEMLHIYTPISKIQHLINLLLTNKIKSHQQEWFETFST